MGSTYRQTPEDFLKAGDYFWEVVDDDALVVKVVKRQVCKVEDYYKGKRVFIENDNKELVSIDGLMIHHNRESAELTAVEKLEQHIKMLQTYLSHLLHDSSVDPRTKEIRLGL